MKAIKIVKTGDNQTEGIWIELTESDTYEGLLKKIKMACRKLNNGNWRIQDVEGLPKKAINEDLLGILDLVKEGVK